jgi:hypothetical protein
LELKLSQLPHIDYVKINKVNKSIEFHLKVKSYTEEYRETIEKINSICNDEGVEASFLEIKNLELFPTDDCGEIFRNYFIHDDVQKGNKLKNADIFKRRILGLVSF